MNYPRDPLDFPNIPPVANLSLVIVLPPAQASKDQRASSQPSTNPVEEERIKRLQNLKIALHKMQKERDELRSILAHYPGKNLNDRINFESEILTMQHQEIMSDLRKMSEQINYALIKCKHLTLENDWYCRRFCLLLTEFFELKNNAQRARNENRELLWDQIALEESIKETTRFCGEASMKIRVTSRTGLKHSSRSLPRAQTRTTALRDRTVHQEH